jgi:hypothetical protein
LALARITAVAISVEYGNVTFEDVREALHAEGLEAPPAALIFRLGSFLPVGNVGGQPAWKAV